LELGPAHCYSPDPTGLPGQLLQHACVTLGHGADRRCHRSLTRSPWIPCRLFVDCTHRVMPPTIAAVFAASGHVLDVVLQFSAAHVHGPPYTLDAEAGFIFPSSLRPPFSIPILPLCSSITTRTATARRHQLRLPPLQEPLQSPSGTPILSMLHCRKNRPSQRVIEAPKLPQRPPRMPPHR
jgi:hypothetical protein